MHMKLIKRMIFTALPYIEFSVQVGGVLPLEADVTCAKCACKIVRKQELSQETAKLN